MADNLSGMMQRNRILYFVEKDFLFVVLDETEKTCYTFSVWVLFQEYILTAPEGI